MRWLVILAVLTAAVWSAQAWWFPFVWCSRCQATGKRKRLFPWSKRQCRRCRGRRRVIRRSVKWTTRARVALRAWEDR